MAKIKLSLQSNAFEYGAAIPTEYTCDGVDRAPDLHWTHTPDGTQSFVLIADDPDAPGGTFTHWVRFDIPSNRNVISREGPPVGSDGRNDFQVAAYRGPCPPPRGGEHRYFFHLYALDVASLGLPPGAERAQVEQAMEDHVIDEAVLMGVYERK